MRARPTLPPDPFLLDAYLCELRLDAGEPSSVALRALHRAHVQRFANDTVWMSRARIPALDHLSMVRALVGGEGGGCLQLNGALAWLLDQLGYSVEVRRARVQRAFDEVPEPRRDAHMVILVSVEEQRWYADVGMGNGLLEAIPLIAGEYQQPGGFTYRLEESEEPGLAWKFHHDRRLMGLRMAECESESTDMGGFANGFEYDARDPSSKFLQNILVNRRREDGVSTLIGATLIRWGEGGRSVTAVETADEWESALREEFLLGLPEWSPHERDRLWLKARGDSKRG